MTDWFARPVLHVTDVAASLRFYVDQLGFTTPWQHAEDGNDPDGNQLYFNYPNEPG